MSQHIFGAFVTSLGTAANNRGETEGNTTTLQKLVWNGQVHTTVSAESIRFALRGRLQETDAGRLNRTYDEAARVNAWKDHEFSAWKTGKGTFYLDDDLLGYMSAEAAKDEETKGTAKIRRAVLEITRAVSLSPWPGDVTFNAASPGATPSAAKKGENPVPYATEMHATRYQYGISLTPERLKDKANAAKALEKLCALGTVAGNHGRFLFDFSPESVVFRVTQDPAPRLLHGFALDNDGRVNMDAVLRRVQGKDIDPAELVIGGLVVDTLTEDQKKALTGAKLVLGVKGACAEACAKAAVK